MKKNSIFIISLFRLLGSLYWANNLVPSQAANSVKFVNYCLDKVEIFPVFSDGSIYYPNGTLVPNTLNNGIFIAANNTNGETFYVGDAQFDGQFWFQSEQYPNGTYMEPCPSNGCGRMEGTRAAFSYPASADTQSVATYSLQANAGTDPFSYQMSITPNPVDNTCYATSSALNYVQANPVFYNNCPRPYNYTVGLCDDSVQDQTQPVTPLETPPNLTSDQSRYINYINNCNEDIWIQGLNNADSPSNLSVSVVHLAPRANYKFGIDNEGWDGRFFTKSGCEADGEACQHGQQLPVCNKTAGCSPPATLYAEFFVPRSTDINGVQYFDISAVDGFDKYGILIQPVETVYDPRAVLNSSDYFNCTATVFALDPKKDCPYEINFFLNNTATNVSLLSYDGTQCLSPCKLQTWPIGNFWSPGYGTTDLTQSPACWYCCTVILNPDGSVNEEKSITSNKCSNGHIKQTAYYIKLKGSYKNTYAFAFDDKDGTFMCPTGNSYNVTVCPDPADVARVNSTIVNAVKLSPGAA